MPSNIEISGAIVLYKSNEVELRKAVESFLEIPLSKRLFLIDNSPTTYFKNTFDHPDVEYIYHAENRGFGAAHNCIINSLKGFSKYHLVLNPDVAFEPAVILQLIRELDQDDSLTMIAPKVLYTDGSFQHTCRRYPSFIELILRNSAILRKVFKRTISKGEYADRDLSQSFYPDFLHGCFHLYKTKDFIDLKGFDTRYFLYMEDMDICRKIDRSGKKKMYFPQVQITHAFQKGSSRNFRLFLYHLRSALQYFNKWGWFN
ncbi:MAG: glycosyltransferase family 2 protein [Flavobacteriaceae bacterium]|nr:glycosyltransferase family 2 protein [Flavobacteriaceae bacterium]